MLRHHHNPREETNPVLDLEIWDEDALSVAFDWELEHGVGRWILALPSQLSNEEIRALIAAASPNREGFLEEVASAIALHQRIQDALARANGRKRTFRLTENDVAETIAQAFRLSKHATVERSIIETVTFFGQGRIGVRLKTAGDSMWPNGAINIQMEATRRKFGKREHYAWAKSSSLNWKDFVVKYPAIDLEWCEASEA